MDKQAVGSVAHLIWVTGPMGPLVAVEEGELEVDDAVDEGSRVVLTLDVTLVETLDEGGGFAAPSTYQTDRQRTPTRRGSETHSGWCCQ